MPVDKGARPWKSRLTVQRRWRPDEVTMLLGFEFGLGEMVAQMNVGRLKPAGA